MIPRFLRRDFFSFTQISQILNQLFVFGLLVKRSSFKTSPWALLNRDFPSCSIRFIEKTSGTFFLADGPSLPFVVGQKEATV